MDRLAIGLGNKHLGGWTGIDTIGDLGLGESVGDAEASSSKFKTAMICGLRRQNSDLVVGLEISGAHSHILSWLLGIRLAAAVAGESTLPWPLSAA